MDRSEMVEIVLDAVRIEMEAVAEPTNFSGDIDEATPLLGEGAPIDSLGLVSVIVQVEESLRCVDGIDVTLVDEKAMSQRNSPFRSVGALSTYAMECAAAAQQAV